MSNLVILAVYHFSRSGQRLLLEAKTFNKKRLLRDSVSGGQYIDMGNLKFKRRCGWMFEFG